MFQRWMKWIIPVLCDLQNFLTRVENTLGGKDLWIELCTFRRTDTYKNDNFIGEDQPESVLMENMEELLKQASSMASSYSYVARQADKGSKANQQFQNMKENGLDIANTMIKSSDNLDFVWNKYGFKGREWDDVRNEFSPEQLAMTNNLLAFTKDSWEHTCAAIGKISYFDDVDQAYKWDYGINAGVLIGDLVMSEQLRIMNDSGNYYIDKNGFTMVKKDSNGKVLSEIAIKPENPSMVLSRNGESLFDFNSDGKGCLRIGSDTSGITFDQNGNATFAGKISSSSGDIGSWHIDGSGIYNSGYNYLTTIGDRNDYKIEGKNYQTTINNGKIICGVESGDYTSPDTSYGYVDVSARGIYAKTFGRAVTDDYLFALDVQQNLITTNCSNVDIKNNLQCEGTLIVQKNVIAPNIGNICIKYIYPLSCDSNKIVANMGTVSWNFTYDSNDITDIMFIPYVQSCGNISSISYSNGQGNVTMTNYSGESHSLSCKVYIIGYKEISSN